MMILTFIIRRRPQWFQRSLKNDEMIRTLQGDIGVEETILPCPGQNPVSSTPISPTTTLQLAYLSPQFNGTLPMSSHLTLH